MNELFPLILVIEHNVLEKVHLRVNKDSGGTPV